MPAPATILLGLLALLYPLLVYTGLKHFPLQWVGLGIATLLALRALALRLAQRGKPAAALSLWPALVLAAACALLSVVMNQAGSLKLVPVVMNIACLFAFAGTLRHPPSMIERFARLHEPDLDAFAVAYTRKVTQVWCVFFVINGSAALYTALFASMATWTVYNGLISYLLMGLLFGMEYLVRQRMKARQHTAP